MGSGLHRGDLCGVPHTQGLPHRGRALHGRAADQVRSPQLKSKTAYFSFYRKDFIAEFTFFSFLQLQWLLHPPSLAPLPDQSQPSSPCCQVPALTLLLIFTVQRFSILIIIICSQVPNHIARYFSILIRIIRLMIFLLSASVNFLIYCCTATEFKFALEDFLVRLRMRFCQNWFDQLVLSATVI